MGGRGGWRGGWRGVWRVGAGTVGISTVLVPPPHEYSWIKSLNQLLGKYLTWWKLDLTSRRVNTYLPLLKIIDLTFMHSQPRPSWHKWLAGSNRNERVKRTPPCTITLQRQFRLYIPFLGIPRIGPHISSSRKGRPIVGIYNSLTDTWMWKLGLRPRYSFSLHFFFAVQVPAWSYILMYSGLVGSNKNKDYCY